MGYQKFKHNNIPLRPMETNKIKSDKEMPMAGNFGGTIMVICAGTWMQDKNNETLVDC
jgi:frataxin-like iron-binding protein CyaY